METLRIQLFGSLSIMTDVQVLDGAATRKSRALLAYLILAKNRPVARELIAAAFWGDLPEDRARRALNTDFWRLRQVLLRGGLEPARYLDSNHDDIRFRTETSSVDALDFTATLGKATQRPPETASDAELADLSAAVSLYRGDFLEGVYDEWSLQQREHFQVRYQSALDYLLRATLARDHHDEAVRIGTKLLQLDPLQEHVHRILMRCHVALGDRPRAIVQYRQCEAFLNQHLGIEPMQETKQLYGQLAHITPGQHQAPIASKGALLQLREAVNHVESARQSLNELNATLHQQDRDH